MIMIVPRLAIAVKGGAAGPFFRIFPWLVRSREINNWTYETTRENKLVLCATIAIISGEDVNKIIEYCDELYGDIALQSYLASACATSGERWHTDQEFKPGRRLANYLLTRALKPKIVVEAGVDKGFSSVLISRALKLNSVEGHKGTYVGIEYNEAKHVDIYYRYPEKVGHIERVDSISFLQRVRENIDLFIHDTTSDADHMQKQLAAVKPKMSAKGVIVSVWTNMIGIDYALKNNFEFLTHKDEPVRHWHPGARLLFMFHVD